jgi:hypothetical protein
VPVTKPPIHRRSTLSTPPNRRKKDRHDVQSYKGPGYAACARDDDAPHPADVYEGEPAAVHEGDIAHAQPGAGTASLAHAVGE